MVVRRNLLQNLTLRYFARRFEEHCLADIRISIPHFVSERDSNRGGGGGGGSW